MSNPVREIFDAAAAAKRGELPSHGTIARWATILSCAVTGEKLAKLRAERVEKVNTDREQDQAQHLRALEEEVGQLTTTLSRLEMSIAEHEQMHQELKERNAALEAGAMFLQCAYCDAKFERTDPRCKDAIIEHMLTCEKSLAASAARRCLELEVENERLRAALAVFADKNKWSEMWAYGVHKTTWNGYFEIDAHPAVYAQNVLAPQQPEPTPDPDADDQLEIPIGGNDG